MKKNKIILVAIAVMTIAGGTLAFKAQNKGTDVYTTDGVGKAAINLVEDSRLSSSGAATIASDVFNAPAASTFTTFNQ